jgi:hypothetical protein
MKIKIFCRCSLFLPGRTKDLSTPLYSNTKFYEKPSTGSRVVPCGQTGTQTLWSWVTIRNFANTPNKTCFLTVPFNSGTPIYPENGLKVINPLSGLNFKFFNLVTMVKYTINIAPREVLNCTLHKLRYGKGTTLQTGRSRVRFPMVSLEFFSDIIMPVTLWPWGRLSL